MEIDQATLKRYLSYDEDEGVLRWNYRPEETKDWNDKFAGQHALGALCGGGYNGGRFMGVMLRACRVVFCYVHGYWPEQVDHIDGDRRNDRKANLREVTNAQNGRNRRMLDSNKSGQTGVSWVTRTQKWRASITFDGKRMTIGEYANKETAIRKRQERERELGFHENHGRRI